MNQGTIEARALIPRSSWLFMFTATICINAAVCDQDGSSDVPISFHLIIFRSKNSVCRIPAFACIQTQREVK